MSEDIIFGEDGEIEYLSEEEILKLETPDLNLFYVYFDETGTVNSITNERKTDTTLNFIEVEHKRVESFLTGKDNISNYKVSLVDKDTLMLIKKTEDAGTNTNLFLTIEDSTSGTLIVNWDSVNKHWKFSLDSEYKAQYLGLGLSATVVFFITLKENFNFLVRTIAIDVKELAQSDSVIIPWELPIEENQNALKINTKKFFDSYGIVYE